MTCRPFAGVSLATLEVSDLVISGLVISTLAFAAVGAHAQAGRVWFENEFVRVTADAAPCATPATRECGDRAIVAMGDMEIVSGGSRRALARGDILVFPAGAHSRSRAAMRSSKWS